MIGLGSVRFVPLAPQLIDDVRCKGRVGRKHVAEGGCKSLDAVVVVRVEIELEDVLLVNVGIKVLLDPGLESLDCLGHGACDKEASRGLIGSKGVLEEVLVEEHHPIEEV